jgi:hypothetical protein
MSQYLKPMLELAFEPYNERKKELVSALPSEMHYMQDGAIKTVKRELLLSEAIESGLIQTEVHNTVAEGADLAKCFFNALESFKIKGNAYNYPVGEDGLYAAEVAEGAEFPNRTQNYSNIAFAVKKYGVSPKITNEMVEDGMVDVIASEIKFAGVALQNKVEQVCLNEVLLASTSVWDTTGTNQGLKGIMSGASVLKGLGYFATDVIMCAEAEGLVKGDVATVGTFGGSGMAANGNIPNGFFGLNWHVSGVAYTAGTYTWSYDTADDEGMMVIDRTRAAKIGIARPLTVENYDDPVRDLKGMACSIRMDCQALVPAAICRIQF